MSKLYIDILKNEWTLPKFDSYGITAFNTQFRPKISESAHAYDVSMYYVHIVLI